MPLTDVIQVEVQLYGERNFPAGSAVIPQHLLADYNVLYESARRTYPTYTHESLVRYIFLKGMDSLRAGIRRGALAKPDDVPKPSGPLLTEAIG